MIHFKSKSSYLKNYVIKLVVENKSNSKSGMYLNILNLSGYFLPFNI